jgi:hypothetical protein
MANTAAPFGLRPVRRLDGAPWTGQARHYLIPSSVTTDAFVGDPVDIAGDANATEVTVIGGVFAPGTLPTVAVINSTNLTGLSTNKCLGAIVGFAATSRDSGNYGAGSTARVALVADDPDLIFEIQDDGAAALAITASVGLNAVMNTGAGSTATGQSAYVMDTDGGTPAASVSSMLYILGLSKKHNNEIGTYATWDVVISNHRMRGSNTGGFIGA